MYGDSPFTSSKVLCQFSFEKDKLFLSQKTRLMKAAQDSLLELIQPRDHKATGKGNHYKKESEMRHCIFVFCVADIMWNWRLYKYI